MLPRLKGGEIMLRIYKMPNGKTYQFEETKAPDGAVLVETEIKAVEPSNKAVKKPANKTRKAVKK